MTYTKAKLDKALDDLQCADTKCAALVRQLDVEAKGQAKLRTLVQQLCPHDERVTMTNFYIRDDEYNAYTNYEFHCKVCDQLLAEGSKPDVYGRPFESPNLVAIRQWLAEGRLFVEGGKLVRLPGGMV